MSTQVRRIDLARGKYHAHRYVQQPDGSLVCKKCGHRLSL